MSSGLRIARPAELVIASANPGKHREFRAILESFGDEAPTLRNLSEFPLLAFPEEGDDYLANAVGKARAVSKRFSIAAIADDSGLEVDGLGGAPGPRSARYGGPELDDRRRLEHLLAEMKDLRGGARRARFICCVALSAADGEVATARGECPGTILEGARGGGGFGYDPVFQPDGQDRSMAELPAALKNRISHRGRALRGIWERLDNGPLGGGAQERCATRS